MTDDLLKRARQELQLHQPRREVGAPLDPSKLDDLLARARRIGGNQLPAIPAVTAVAPARADAENVRLHMTCGATGQRFIGLAERRKDNAGTDALLLIGHELLAATAGAASGAELLSGEYRLDAVAGWACPHCQSRAEPPVGWWICNCAEHRGALHCGGSHGQARYCACGRLEVRELVPSAMVKVRGASVATASMAPRSGASPPHSTALIAAALRPPTRR